MRSYGALPRVVAVCGTFLGNGFLYLRAVQLTLPVQALADILIIAGTIGALVAASRLGGSFSLMPEARKLVTTGPYAVIRHPLYLAEMVGILGLVLQFEQPWALLLGAAVFGLQYWRTIDLNDLAIPSCFYETVRVRIVGSMRFSICTLVQL